MTGRTQTAMSTAIALAVSKQLAEMWVREGVIDFHLRPGHAVIDMTDGRRIEVTYRVTEKSAGECPGCHDLPAIVGCATCGKPPIS